MPEMNITVRNKIATKTDNMAYVCGNSDYVINFAFDGEWDAYDTKTARFAYGGQHTDVVFTGNQCNVPVITNTYAFHVGVFAGDLHTTTAARVPCRKCILCGSGAPSDPPENVYDQLMERMAQLETSDWAQNDPTAKDYVRNRPFYSAIEEQSIAGVEYKYVSYDGTAHEELPFELGQVWNAEFVTTSYNDLHVKQADDGTLYIGDLGLSSPPFFVSVTSGGANSAWKNNMQPGGLTLIGVSGTVVGKVVHTLPDEYLSANIARKSDIPENRIMLITARGINAAVNFGDYTDVLLLIKAATPGHLKLRLLLVNGENKNIINCKTGSAVVDGEQPYGVMAIMCDVVNDTYTLLNPL